MPEGSDGTGGAAIVLILQLVWRVIGPKGRASKPPQAARRRLAPLPSETSVPNG